MALTLAGLETLRPELALKAGPALQTAVTDLLFWLLHGSPSLLHCFQKLLPWAHLHTQHLPQVGLAEQHQSFEVDSFANKLWCPVMEADSSEEHGEGGVLRAVLFTRV